MLFFVIACAVLVILVAKVVIAVFCENSLLDWRPPAGPFPLPEISAQAICPGKKQSRWSVVKHGSLKIEHMTEATTLHFSLFVRRIEEMAYRGTGEGICNSRRNRTWHTCDNKRKLRITVA